MAPRLFLFLALLCLILAGQPAAANCEAGGYFIHTTAEYLTKESRLWFFRYEVLGRELRLIPVETLRGEVLPELLAASRRMSIEHDRRLCTVGGRGGEARVVRVEVETNTIGFEDQLALPHCFSPRSLPRSGYASYDRESGLLRLASALPVDHAPGQAVPERVDVERWIQDNLFKLGLKVDERAEQRIAPDDVERLTFSYTLAGGERPFTMAVAILRLRDLDRLFHGDRHGNLPAYSSQDLAGRLADFPVIFFRQPGERPFYVGDGSWCASERLQRPSTPDVRNLGPLERFQLTGAYDLDRDSLPDLLEINHQFVYFLSPDGGLQVIDYGLGC